jgi:hypothetical protein
MRNNLEGDYKNNPRYIYAKKRVDNIKGFFWHAVSYVIVNIFISAIIIVGMTSEGASLKAAFGNFGVWATWLFWGIGLFFHWLGVYGSQWFFSKDWEERKIKEYLDERNKE